MDGEIYRYCCSLNNKKSNLLVTNRRLMCVKEMEILGHRSMDWDYSYEDFLHPPTVEDNALILSVKDHSISMFQKKENAVQEVKKRITLHNSTVAQNVLKALDEARSACQQQTLVRQKSKKFIKQYSN